jgi:linoleoyl-CoA desaturase
MTPNPTFAPATGFKHALETSVDEYFRRAGISKTGNLWTYLKATLLLAWLAGSYYLLVFRASTWPGGVLVGLSLALAMAAVGFNIQHDGNHGSFSSHPWMNRLAGLTLDLLGASSYLWIWKHNFSHHTYTNIPHVDDDIDLAPVGRLSSEIPLRSYHRYQHYYLWFFYALLLIQWHFYSDYKKLWTRKIGDRTFAPPRGWDLAGVVAGKVVFLSLAFIIPFLRHPWWVVVASYLGVTMVVGLVISVVFQLAHIVEETEHPASLEDVHAEWVIHQIRTTADFACENRLVTWYLGGLNFQVIHHLFPRICHVHYPQVARVVAQVCQEYQINYRTHRSVYGAIRSHFRFLRLMGRTQEPLPPCALPASETPLNAAELSG